MSEKQIMFRKIVSKKPLFIIQHENIKNDLKIYKYQILKKFLSSIFT